MSYKTIRSGAEAEIEVKKSRFIASTLPVFSEQEAQEFLAFIRKKYHDAKHHCYAYTVGSRFDLQRSSDDGEPSGTAGRPILELLTQGEIHNCIVVVTRYFGGTLLGTGGLIRAYQTAAKMGLQSSGIVEKLSGRKYTVRTDYRDAGKLQSVAADECIPITNTRYTDVVETDLIVPQGREKAFCLSVTNATSARAEIIPKETIDYTVDGSETVVTEEKKGGSDEIQL